MISTDTLYLEVNLGEAVDVVGPNSNFQFIILERAGNILPLLEGTFNLPTDAGQLMINQGVELTVTYGQTEDTAISTIWRITGYKLVGTLLNFRARPNLNYNKTRNVSVYNTTSVEAISQVAGNYFTVEDLTTGYTDQMRWLNPRMLDQTFVNEIWKHSFKENGLLIPAITADNRFILKDVLDIQDITTVGNSEDSDIFSRSPTNEITDQSDKYNRILGDPFTFETQRIDGSYTSLSSNLSPLFGEIFNRRYTNNPWETGFASDNVHSNYHQAKTYNISRLAALASLTSSVALLELVNLNLLDHVDLRMTQYGGSDYMDLNSGTHFVKTKETHISNQNLSVQVWLAQDSMTIPDIQGDLT